MMEEIWKDIKGFEGRYQVSNLGRVKRLSTSYYRDYPRKKNVLVCYWPEKIQTIKHTGKVRLRTIKGEIDHLFDVGHLVAQQFIEGYMDGMEVRHIDGNITNNHVGNLEIFLPKTIDNEEWKDVKGFEGRYQVSNMGRVRSLDRLIIGKNGNSYIRKGQMLKPSPNNNKKGYLKVSLSDGNRNYTHIEMQRLVALHFCEGYKPGLVVNHKDECVTNNRADNLEWCTYQYNLTYSDHVAWKRKPVYQYDLDGNFIKKFECGIQAERELGFTIVHAIYESKRGYTHGFLFSLEPHTKEYWDKVTKENKGSTRRVAQCDDNDNEIARFNTVTEAAKAMNVTLTCISNCCRGKTIHAAGYKWKFI